MNVEASLPRVRAAVERLRRDGDGPVCAYVYDLPALKKHARWMRQALPKGCELFYAAKANSDAPLLQTLAPWVDGFEVASGGELRWLRECQPNRPLLFGGPGKLERELTLALEQPNCTLHVESLGELSRLAAMTARQPCQASFFLRMNISVTDVTDTHLVMGGKPTPFGMDEADLPAAMQQIRQSPWLRLEGFHFHLMSHQRNADMHLKLVRAYLEAAHRWQRDYRVTVHTVNAGGGFGVDYADPGNSFDWLAFCQGLEDLLAERCEPLRLRFEPGRYVSAACGWYLMEVLDIKRSHGEYVAIARGGTHHFRTPPAQGHNHPFFVLRGPRQPTLRDTCVTLVGQLCTPKDVLAHQQPVAELALGDCLAFPLAGAYAWNISHQNFLMHPPPRMIYLT